MADIFKYPVLGIDLGASFTKVSVRPAWSSGRKYEELSRTLVIEGNPLVPSLAIFQGRTGKWLTGKTAANYKCKPEDHVFRNWKEAIFSKELNTRVDGCLDAAGNFFLWLKKEVERQGLPVSDYRVKVCLPAFDDIAGPAALLAQRMERCGWNNVSISRLTEPRANANGVFSEGRNCLYRQFPTVQPNPIFPEIFASQVGVIDHFYNHVMVGTQRRARIALIDVGSFTTDISIVDLDAQGDADCLVNPEQWSFQLGFIRAIEDPIRDFLDKHHDVDLSGLSFIEVETLKRDLTAGSPIALTNRKGKSVEVGGERDKTILRGFADRFAKAILREFRGVKEAAAARWVIVTGGGASAAIVRDALKAEAQGVNIKLHWLDGDLARCATALGAASVLLDLPAETPPSLMEERTVVSPYVICPCRGGNKDCMRCNGAGQYKRRA